MDQQERNEYRSEARDVVRETRWTTFKVIFGLLIPVSLVLVVLAAVVWPLIRGAGVADRVFNPDHMISSYEQFHDQFGSWKAREKQIEEVAQSIADFKEINGDSDDWSPMKREECGYLQSDLRGLRYAQDELEEEYNANSRKMNKALFKDENLPDQLPPPEGFEY